MNTELQQLKDIHLPQAINTWPLAPGWLALYALAFGLLCYLLYFWYQRRQKRKTIKFAMAKLKALQPLLVENPDSINIAAEISILIRRTALHYFPRMDIAGLAGDQWLAFLNRSGKTAQFTDETGRLLLDAPYRKINTNDLTPLFALTQSWLVAISKKKSAN
jgi:hypothetical protein